MEYFGWPKTPRLFRGVIVTEKLDGTNSAVLIEEHDVLSEPHPDAYRVHGDDVIYSVQAQSRNRLITPNREGNKQADNYGFAGWVYGHAEDLVRALGPGRHFGEWWGQGIARNYGLSEKRFSLFNPDFNILDIGAWANLGPQLQLVPVLARGVFSTLTVREALGKLIADGSVAAPGFDKPEGVIVYHTAARQGFKVLCENDELPKGVVENPAAAARMRWNASGL